MMPWRAAPGRPEEWSLGSALGVAAVALSLMFAGGVDPARAAFEIRPSAELSSPLLPLCLPAALNLAPMTAGPMGARWSAAALHLMLAPASGLYLDAAGLRVDRSRWGGRMGLTRLGLPGYAEWEADVGAVSASGFSVEASLFRTQPSDLLRLAAGIEPREAASFSAAWVRPLGSRIRAAVWVRDFASAGDHLALGIERRAGGRVDCTPGTGWTVSLLREWGGGRSRPETRLALAWRPFPVWRLEQALGRGSGGESTALQVESGGLTCMAWTARLAGGIPPVSGFAIGGQTIAEAGEPPVAQRVSILPEAVAPVADRSPSPAFWDEWELLPGEDHLVIDGDAVPLGFEADSLGEWADSLEDAAVADRGAGRGELPLADRTLGVLGLSDSIEPGASADHGPSLRLASWSRLRAEDVPAVEGIDAAARDRFVAAVRADGPSALADAIGRTPDPVARRLLLETAPYASARSPDLTTRQIGPAPRPFVRWSREIRNSLTSATRASDRWELHASPIGAGIHVAGRRPPGSAISRGSWTALLEAGNARLVLGRGSPPLTWGAGLWLRSRTIEIRTDQPPGGTKRNKAGDVPPSPAAGPTAPAETFSPGHALAPSSSGKERVLAGEVVLGSGTTRLTAMHLHDRTWIACERMGSTWCGGILAGIGRAGGRLGLLASMVGRGGTHQIELGIEKRGPLRIALRSAGATPRAEWGRAWWDVEGRSLISQARSAIQATPAPERVSPDRRFRLRGTIAAGSLNVGAALEVREDGVGTTDVEALRCGRSLQVRMAVRPRPRIGLTLRATGSDGRTVRDADGERHTRSSRRLRLHLTAERGGEIERRRSAANWFLDAGYDRRESLALPSAGAGRTEREGRWLGVAARIRLTGQGDLSLGAVDVTPPAGGTLVVSPGWSGGASFSAGRGGLWGTGRLRLRLAWLRLDGRGSWPLLPAGDRTRAARPSWALTCGVEA
jgi:hypothetical protein